MGVKKDSSPKSKGKAKAKQDEVEDDDEEEIDYAATADAMFAAAGDSSDEKGDSDGDSEPEGGEEKIEGGSDDDNDDDDDKDSDSSEGSSDVEPNEVKADEENENEDSEESEEDDSVDEEEEGEDENGEQKPIRRFVPKVTAIGGEQCTYDLRNLLALNAHQLRVDSLYGKKISSADDEKCTIPPSVDLVRAVNEDYLLEKATDGCTQLISALWQLPMERSDAGPMAVLPTFDESNIPRALPPPAPKAETKWEQFAKEKGIGVNKEKRSQKVWDEATGTWMFRHGYKKANSGGEDWPIMEVKGGQDPFEDPWERLRESKRSRTNKNLESQLKNQERAGSLPRGTTTRLLKSREKIRQAGKAGGDADRDRPLPAGVPVDLRASRDSGELKPVKLRGKESTTKALLATQRSTASLGKFDKIVAGEPERRKALSSLKKRKFESATDKKVVESEKDRHLKVLKSVVEGGVEKEKARKKGKLATGETAYDYEFNDGLGPSTFRKKKGRAGAGKMKKMTKKRTK